MRFLDAALIDCPRGSVLAVTADGGSTVEYTADYDSVECHVTSSATANGIALRKVDAYQRREATLTPAGRVVGRDPRRLQGRPLPFARSLLKNPFRGIDRSSIAYYYDVHARRRSPA
jgi:hypothetical protein